MTKRKEEFMENLPQVEKAILSVCGNFVVLLATYPIYMITTILMKLTAMFVKMNSKAAGTGA